MSIKYGLDIVRFVISISAPDITQMDICQQFDITKRYICFFGDNSPAAKDANPTGALVCMTLFGKVYVHVPKRAGDQY